MDEKDRSTAFAIAKAVADTSRDGLILYDRDGRALHRNPVATVFLAGTHDRAAVESAIEQLALTAMRSGEARGLELTGFAIFATPHLCTLGCFTIITVRAEENGHTEVALRARFGFSPRESQVAALLARRRTDGEIAAALGISWHTVRSHVERVFRILGASNRRQAADKLSEQGRGSPMDP